MPARPQRPRSELVSGGTVVYLGPQHDSPTAQAALRSATSLGATPSKFASLVEASDKTSTLTRLP